MEVDELQNREGYKNNEINNLYNGDYIYLFLVYLFVYILVIIRLWFEIIFKGHIVGMDGMIKINIIKYISTTFIDKNVLYRRVITG